MSGSDFLELIHRSCTGIAVPLRNEHDYSRLRHCGMHVRSPYNGTDWMHIGVHWPSYWWTDEFLQRTSSAQDTVNRTETHDGAYQSGVDPLTAAHLAELYLRMNFRRRR